MEAHLTGAFPRSEMLIEATRAAERGKLSREEVSRAFDQDVAGLIQLQQDLRLDSVVDGQLNWQDLFRPFSEILTGIRLGGLMRWFDNNTFFRQPKVIDKIGIDTAKLGDFFHYALIPIQCHKKAILPGPFTFAVMAQNSAYTSLADLIDDFSHALRHILAELGNVGYSYAQFNEPALCIKGRTKNDLELAKAGLDACTAGYSGKTILHTYFLDATPIIDSMQDFPVDCIGIDFYATPTDALSKCDFEKELGCGCVDGRNSLLETTQGLHDLISKIQKTPKPEKIILCPNCDLDFLPRPVAEKKLRLLAEGKARFNT